MNFSIQNDNNISIITINREIANIELVQEFKNLVTEIIDRHSSGIVIDFSNTALIDSTFLGAIVLAHKKMKGLDGEVKLCGVSENVMLSLGLSKIDKIIKVYSTRDEAAADFS